MLKKFVKLGLLPLPPERLGMIRILVGLFTLWYLLVRFNMFLDVADSAPSMYEPVGLALIFGQPLSIAAFKVLLIGTIVLNIGFILGWKYRITGPSFALSFLLLMCYRNSWSMLYHNYNTLVLHVCVLGFSLAAASLSLDSRQGKMSHLPAWHFWLARAAVGCDYSNYLLFVRSCKLYGDLAWEWVSGAAMRSQVAVDGIRKEVLADGIQPFFEWLYPHTSIFLIMGVVAMVAELGAPLAFVNRKIGIAWSLLALSMHWGIYFIMGIKFPYHYSGFIYLSFFPLEYLYRQLKAVLVKHKPGSSPKTDAAKSIVLFDGICNLCNSSVQFIINNDPKGRFEFASLQSLQGQKLMLQFGRSANELSSLILLEEGQIFSESTAALRIAKSLRFPFPILTLGLVLPRGLRDAAYRLVARNRYRWFGKTQDDQCWISDLTNRGRFVS